MTDMHKVLEDRAAAASVPPADLVEKIERGYRRRRRGRVVTAAFAAVLLLAGGTWATLGTFDKRADLPAEPVVYAPFRIPDSLDSPPPAEQTWPGAIRDDAPNLRGTADLNIYAVGALDGDHLLVTDNYSFSSYDVRTGTGDVLVASVAPGIPGARLRGSAIAPQWIVWLAEKTPAGAEFSVYRVPRTGGVPELVADDVRIPMPYGHVYATDEFLFWSTGSGVARMSLSDGKAREMPGFDGLVVDGSIWAVPAVVTASGPVPPQRRLDQPDSFLYRNVVTGEWRSADVREPDRSFRCLPDWCVGRLADGRQFVQRPDGSHRTLLPVLEDGRVWMALWAGDDGFLGVLDDKLLLDPDTGRFGRAIPAGLRKCGGSWQEIGGRLVIRWGDSATCPRGRIHLTTTD